MVRLKKLCAYLNDYLQIHDFTDPSQNGLQVEGPKEVELLAVAVDARQKTIDNAAKAGAQMLLTHHGLFWGRSELLRGIHYKRVRTLLQNDLALYTAHIPLDAHLEVGNNAVIAREMGLKKCKPFGKYRGAAIGIQGLLPEAMPFENFMAQTTALFEPVGGVMRALGGGKRKVRKIGIVTGDAANEIPRAARAGLDVLVTGEPDHVMAMIAEEERVHLVCGGHYATETFGVRALADHLSEKFDIDTTFIHAPTKA